MNDYFYTLIKDIIENNDKEEAIKIIANKINEKQISNEKEILTNLDKDKEIERLNKDIEYSNHCEEQMRKTITNLEYKIATLEEQLKEAKKSLGIISPSRELKEGKYWENEEIERLNNIINELEKWLKGGGIIDFDIEHQVLAIKDILNKLQELKGSDKE